MSIIVVKVGGSLFGLPDLRQRLNTVLSELDADCVLLVAGGGASADAVRDLQRIHGISDRAAHFMAMDSMRVGEGLLQALVPKAVAVSSALNFETRIGIVQASAFVAGEQANHPMRPREDWNFASDSIAAWVASVVGARQVLLLKSVSAPPSIASSDTIDDAFTDYIGNTRVLWCNLREGTRFAPVPISVE